MGEGGAYFIPKKRNKEGKLFGFVRFEDVVEIRSLEERLDQIWVGTYKLRVNLSRFHRGKEPEERVGKQNHMQAKTGSQTRKMSSGNVIAGVRYADVVANRVWKQKATREEGKKMALKWKGVEYKVKEEDMEWLKSCYVGKVHSPDDVLTLQ